MQKGIDVSKHNGTIDWAKAKASGIQFAMIRAGYGQTNIDPQFKRNISECNRLGIPCGVYWFSYAYTEEMARKEAAACLSAIKPYKLDYPVAFDFEYDSVDYAAKKGVTITKALASRITKAFCGAVEAAGYYVLNYANADYLSRYFDAEVRAAYDLWLAQWPKAPNLSSPPECGIWQYSSTGSVPGISGNVDLNAAYKDYPAIINKTSEKTEEKKEVAPVAKVEKTETEKERDAARAWVMSQGISDGTNPDSPATRSQVWVMLYRTAEKLLK